MKVRLTDEEHAQLVKLYREAQTTPVLVYGYRPGQDTASNAWSDVAAYMRLLGRKYGFEYTTARIRMDSPEFDADPSPATQIC